MNHAKHPSVISMAAIKAPEARMRSTLGAVDQFAKVSTCSIATE